MKFFPDTKKYILHKNITGKIIRTFVRKPRPIKQIKYFDVCLPGIPSLCSGGPRCDRFFSVEHTRSSLRLTSTVINVTNIVIVANVLYRLNKDL
jgi:hypothetical protein